MAKLDLICAVMLLCADAAAAAVVSPATASAKARAPLLFKAIEDKDADKVKSILSVDPLASIELMSPIYEVKIAGFATITTPIHFAACVGDLAVFKTLLAFVDNYDTFANRFVVMTKAGTSAYHLAMKAGHIDITNAIVAFVGAHEYALPLIGAGKMMSPVLHIAADKGDCDSVKKLLDLASRKPAVQNVILAKDNEKRNALHFAIRNADEQMVRELLGSPFRSRFLEDAELIPIQILNYTRMREMWRLVLGYAPQLAPLHEDTVGLEDVGQHEAAFFNLDAERCWELSTTSLDFELLQMMFANSEKKVDEQAYINLILELNPMFYLVWPILKLFEYFWVVK